MLAPTADDGYFLRLIFCGTCWHLHAQHAAQAEYTCIEPFRRQGGRCPNLLEFCSAEQERDSERPQLQRTVEKGGFARVASHFVPEEFDARLQLPWAFSRGG